MFNVCLNVDGGRNYAFKITVFEALHKKKMDPP